MGFLQVKQFGPGFNSMSPASTRWRETTAGKASPLSEKTAIDFFLPGRSGGPSLWGACLIDFIWSLGSRVVGVASERLQQDESDNNDG